MRPLAILALVSLCWLAGCAADAEPAAPAASTTPPTELTMEDVLKLTDADWKRRLTPEQYSVLRRKGTEPAFCGGYTATKHHGEGTYHCAGCGVALFTSETKFDSGSGWPSFFQPIPGRIAEERDNSHGMERIEVHCARCGGHMGHLFDDGPRPTGMRYCINAVSLTFVAKAPAEKK